MNILVTGGAGYIGSHTCVSLIEAGHDVVIADDFSNGYERTIEKLHHITKRDIPFYHIDVTKEDQLHDIFNNHSFDGVIHFAGLKVINESINYPFTYYFNNIVSLLVLLHVMKKHHVNRLIFSSSASVYGKRHAPLKETMNQLQTTNPYAETKAICEKMLIDIAEASNHFTVSILRYFNPVGAHESGLIGESFSKLPNNIMPHIIKVAKGELERLTIYGTNNETEDNTGIRDYVHVMDLAEGHVAAIENLKQQGSNIYNLGTGEGTSVLELVHAFEKVTKIKIPYHIIESRPGDIISSFADVTKVKEEINWSATRDILMMCRDAWRFEKRYSMKNE